VKQSVSVRHKSNEFGYLCPEPRRANLVSKYHIAAGGSSQLTVENLAVRFMEQEDMETAVALTSREIEVLRLLSTGMSNRDIAAILCVAEGTAKTHVEHIIDKLGVSNRVQAAVWGARRRIC
jgi:DNA-binding NarL/FixJ family response regulator